MKQDFAAIILGRTGQVGGAVVAELLTISHLSPRHHCWKRSYAGLGRLVGKPRAWAVWQY
jgi:hypothetical protein